MAYDPDLAGRVRAARRGLRTGERRMFGGLAFMVGGKMACGVAGEELMARVGTQPPRPGPGTPPTPGRWTSPDAP